MHFVCRGNTFRSRLAAAYFYLLVGDDFHITSSGIDAGNSVSRIQTAESYTKATARHYGLHHGITKHKTATTLRQLQDADVIVFMEKGIYDDARKEYDFDERKALVWNVADVDSAARKQALAARSDRALVELADPAFRHIRELCDSLRDYLARTAWVDVMDAKNMPVGLRLPISWVTDRGLWHRGVHIVAQTLDGRFVVEKRDSEIVFAPGMLDISLGGGVDSGERPLDAAVRETYEELGVKLPARHFKPLFMYKQVGYHPHYRKQTRAHLYVYHVRLPVTAKELLPQAGEVAEVRALSRRQINSLLRRHRLKHFGRLKWGYKLYAKAVAYSHTAV